MFVECLKVLILEVGLCILFVLLECIVVLVCKVLIKLGIDVLEGICVVWVEKVGFIIVEEMFIEVDLMVWFVGVKVFDFIVDLNIFELNRVN